MHFDVFNGLHFALVLLILRLTADASRVRFSSIGFVAFLAFYGTSLRISLLL